MRIIGTFAANTGKLLANKYALSFHKKNTFKKYKSQNMCDISGDNTADAWPNRALANLSDFVRQQLELCQELIKPSTKPDVANFMTISESFPARVCIACLDFNNFFKCFPRL